ncbi:MAG: hypothetical protein AABY22_02615, partial [Nanoarchaeota archaeon]
MLDILSKFENYEIENFGLIRLPEIVISKEQKEKYGLDEKTNNLNFLKQLVYQGYEQKLKNNKIDYKRAKEYGDRCKYELDIIDGLGFTDYVLLVWDIINFCDIQGIPRGAGRGSAGGSLIFHLIGITKYLDPLNYPLYFERFISKARAKKTIIDGITYIDGSLAPDFDLDVCHFRRNEVVEYLKTKYPNKVAKLSTFNTFSGRLLIKECGKIISEKSESEMNEISELIPKIFGQVKDIEETYQEVPKFKEWCDNNREIYDIALSLRGLIKNRGSHASGYAISYFPIEEIV